ncbi:hypothetical protein OG21DRAFT_544834 [Imleria badia]|nr:hypothetical protein OG21DRAFT_544834 [Imleria badia]
MENLSSLLLNHPPRPPLRRHLLRLSICTFAPIQNYPPPKMSISLKRTMLLPLDETETEGEDTPPTCFPFPPLSSVFNHEINPTKSSLVPSKSSPPANLLLESLNPSTSSFSSTSLTTKLSLTGTILTRNLAFEKHVAIRFTLDDWRTTSEVGAHYVNPPSLLPSQVLSSSSPSTPADTSSCRGRGWDRFIFTICLEDYAHSLSTRTLWLAARYRIDSTYPEPGSSQYGPGGEWWDNHGGGNYRLGFRPAVVALTSLEAFHAGNLSVH